jgi:ATP-dependent DNA ligase
MVRPRHEPVQRHREVPEHLCSGGLPCRVRHRRGERGVDGLRRLEGLPEDYSIDGEVLALRDGKPEFSALLERLGRRADSRVQFVAFDLLRAEEEELSALPLRERRSRLESIVPKGGPICVTVQTEMFEVAEKWLAQSRVLHLEGVVAKRANEPYRNGKRSWVKVKHWDTIELVVGGYAGTAERMSLLLGAYDENGSLIYMGQTVAIPLEEAAELTRSRDALL